MQLAYLLFDRSEEDDGACSFDALASVLPARLPALAAEVEAVLAWAWRQFGPPAAGADPGEWDFDLQASDAHDAVLDTRFDARSGRLALPPAVDGRVTIALTLTGSAAFAAAFQDAFPDDAD